MTEQVRTWANATSVADSEQTFTKRKQHQTHLSAERQRQLAMGYQAGTLIKDLAVQYNVHRVTVTAILKRQGLR